MKSILIRENLWNHYDTSQLNINLSCSQVEKNFAGQFVNKMARDYEGFVKLYNRFSLKCHINFPKEIRKYKNTTQAITTFNENKELVRKV